MYSSSIMSLPSTNIAKLLGSIGALVGVAAIWHWWWKRHNRDYKVVGKVSRIYIYPVKSCRGISLIEAQCLITGMEHNSMRDREFLIIKNDGHFITARQEPSMLLIVPTIHDGELWLDAPNMKTLKVTKPINENRSSKGGESYKHGTPMPVTIWGEDMVGLDCGEEASQWLSQYIGKPEIKLVYFREKISPRSYKDYNKWDRFHKSDNSIFADLTAYMLLSEASVAGLNAKLDKSVTINNFRPSIAVEGCKEYDEESWKYLKIGSVHFRNVKPCTRCVLTTIDPETGIKDGIEPLRTLKSYKQLKNPEQRRMEGESPVFGVHLSADNIGTIKVGDPVYATY